MFFQETSSETWNKMRK